MSEHIIVEHIPGMTSDEEAQRREEIAAMTPEEFQALADRVARETGREVRITRDNDGLSASAPV